MSELPSQLEPLVLADGTKIDPQTGNAIKDRAAFIEVPTHFQAVKEVTESRRRLSDVPVPPKQMNGISLICFYVLFGLPVKDIAEQTGLTPDRINDVISSDAFGELQQAFMNDIFEQNKESVRGLIAQQQHSAAQQVAVLMNSDDEKVALSAAKDILDRGGNRAVDVVEHRHTMENELRIVVRKEKDDPIIDLGVIDAGI